MSKLKLILSMLIFGTIGVFVKYIPLASSVIALARGFIGTLFLVVFVFCSKKKISGAAIKNNLFLLIFSGAAIGFNWILLFEAYRYTTVANATLYYYLAPVFVIILSPFILKEKLTWTKGVCITIALIGMIFASGIFESQSEGTGNLTGILFGIAAATLYASVILLNKFLKDISSYDSTIMQLGVAALVLLPYTLLMESFGNIALTVPIVILLIMVGIVHTGIAYCLYFSSVADLEGQTIAIFSYIDPVVAILLSALLLKEDMSIWGIIGAVLILGSTLMSELIGNRQSNSETEVRQ